MANIWGVFLFIPFVFWVFFFFLISYNSLAEFIHYFCFVFGWGWVTKVFVTAI